MRKLSKILALALVLVMVFAVVSAFSMTTSAATPEKLYLTPSANWKEGNARFAAYFFGNGEKWVSMTDADKDGVYEVEVPAGFPNVIFCRMNPSATANNWNNRWNQTSDLTIPTSGANHYTVKEGTWDKGGGTWSTLGSTCAHANLGPAATCTNPQVCLECGDPVVSELGHTYNSAHLCTRCNGQAVFTVAGSGAHLGTEWDTGNTANDMTFADGVYTKVYTNVAAGSYLLKVARDHDWGTAYPYADKAYTVATAGSTVTVTLKGTAVTIDITAPHTHTWSDATCTEPAKCECGEVNGEALGHNYVAGEVVAPTYTAGGYTIYTCVCGLTENRDETPALEVNIPAAVVTPLEGTDLTYALTFTIQDLDAILANPEYCQALLAKYGKWYVDYRLTISGLTVDSVTFNAVGESDGYLSGRYTNWEDNIWVNVPDNGQALVVNNGESILVMKKASEMYGIAGLRQTFKDIATNVVTFDCGIFFTPEFLAANPDMVVTLELIVFNEESNEETLVDEHTFTAPEVPHVNTLVVGDTNKIVVSGETLNDWNLPIEWVPFVADEAGFYSFVGDNGALAYIFDANLGLVSATGAANLEAGAYLICLGNGLVGEFNVAVTKSAWVNALALGDNKILITDTTDNGYGYYIVWVPFEVTEKANYTFGGEGLAVLVFDAAYGAVEGTELEVGTYNICIAFATPATTGVATVTVEKTAIGGGDVVDPEDPTLALGDNTVVIDGSQTNLVGNAIAWYTFTPETAGTYTFACDDLTVYVLTSKNMRDTNAYVGNGGVAELEAGVKYYVLVGKDGIQGEFTVNVSLGGVVAEKNTMVVGNNHYVITDDLLSTGFEFLTIEITEPGTYVITGGAPMKVYFFTVLAENVVETSPFGWNVDGGSATGFADSFVVTLGEAGTYMMGFNYEFVTDEREFDITIELHTEHTFEEGKCTVCGEADPNWVDPVEPEVEEKEEELGFFANIWKKILAFLNSIVDFFKNLF